MYRNGFAVLMTVVMVASVAGPAVGTAAADGELAVDVTQTDDVTVTVTDNGTGVANASVVVETEGANASYSGTGNYTTGEDGTASLPAPEQDVTVSVTAAVDNESAATTATLVATENTSRPFGGTVSAFVGTVIKGDTDEPPGQQISTFVLANNPSNAVANASDGNETRGPPENITRGPPENKTRGPPENETQGPPENKTGGPPDDGGPPENKTRGPPENKTGGPPDDGGPPGEDGDTGNGNGNGPPEGERGRDR